MERDTGEDKAQAVLPTKENIELAIDDEHTDQRAPREGDKPHPEPREHETAAGQGNENRAQSLPSLQVEVVQHDSLVEDETGPRNRALSDIRSHDRSKGPAFQMRALEALVEQDPVTRRPDPVAELD